MSEYFTKLFYPLYSDIIVQLYGLTDSRNFVSSAELFAIIEGLSEEDRDRLSQAGFTVNVRERERGRERKETDNLRCDQSGIVLYVMQLPTPEQGRQQQ